MSFDFQFKIETQKEIFAHLAEAIAIHKNKKSLIGQTRNRNWDKGNMLFYGYFLFLMS